MTKPDGLPDGLQEPMSRLWRTWLTIWGKGPYIRSDVQPEEWKQLQEAADEVAASAKQLFR
jgi:hypothetical protein